MWTLLGFLIVLWLAQRDRKRVAKVLRLMADETERLKLEIERLRRDPTVPLHVENLGRGFPLDRP